MKQTNNFKLLLIAIIGFYINNSFAQTLVNEEWATYSALSDTTDIAQSTIDINGNIIITGNVIVAGQQTNIITTKLDQNGNILWQQQYNDTSNGRDYGTAITTDNNGNIYVAGSAYTNATNDQDFVTIKYDANGNLIWAQQYNGTGSGFDEPSAITVDNSSNLFVTGQSKGQNSLQDYATIKYNWYGIEQWVKRYDFADFDDLPTAIVADNLGGVIVTGSSESNFTNADYTTIKYDGSGNQTAILRHSLSASGLDKATSMKGDNSGNVYITGGEYINGKRNIKTLKLNSNLAVQWVQTYDEGYDNFANSINLDDNGYVYVSGYTTKANGEKEILLLKYQSSGTEVWNRKQSAPDGSNVAEAKKVVTNFNNGSIYLGGEINSGVNKNSITIKYNTDGNKKWERIFNRAGNESFSPIDIQQINDVVYIVGKSKQGTLDKFVTIQYKELEQPNIPVYDSTGSPTHIGNEIIVRFDRSALVMNSIYTKAIEFGTLDKFVNSATISLMNSKIGLAGSSIGNYAAIKIFKTLTPNDSISISRLGDTVKIPDFWATFIIELPTNLQEQITVDSLNKCTPNVWYAELNPIIGITDVPNDTKYANEQASLHPTSLYPDANINIEPAWDKEKGKSFVKIGVYDTGIDQNHSELNGKVNGGYNYAANTSLSPPYDNFGHGTGCAGIIGALRNNTTGIAGIAGGDAANSNSGCNLYNMRIMNDAGNLGTGSLVSNAIIDGANKYFKRWIWIKHYE
ncbi:MAG: SBBP repeat-containing protein [Bacteroidetes bacterium]|nr:SBBP repeat-containing protein [Bacteroidota bacterium]